jgi:uncharacterized membrane protein HdeD (DUF308 family)
MAFLTKKTVGLAVILLGGLTMVHGAAAGQAWETLLGLVVLLIGAALLVYKIVQRNSPVVDEPKR